MKKNNIPAHSCLALASSLICSGLVASGRPWISAFFFSTIIAVIDAYSHDIIQKRGLLALVLYEFFLIISLDDSGFYTKKAGYILAIVFNLALSLHQINGFQNPHLIKNKILSPGGAPYNLYLNYDKILTAAITLVTYQVYSDQTEKSTQNNSLLLFFLLNVLNITAVGLLAHVTGFLKPDFRVKKHFLLWFFFNTLFVSPPETILFRVLIQDGLKGSMGPVFAVLISAALHALAHLSGGKKLTGLVMAASSGYGVIHHLFGPVAASISQTSLNAVHFLSARYPT